jgi:RHS repeat-associated protein
MSIRSAIATTFTTPTTTLDMRLPGQSFQLEPNSLHQNHWRDYDPSLGRYIEADPLGIDAGQNVYRYVDGNPLNWEDPWGLINNCFQRGGLPHERSPERPQFSMVWKLWRTWLVKRRLAQREWSDTRTWRS